MALHFILLKPFLLFSKFMFLFPHKNYWQICDSWKLYSNIAYVCFVSVEIITVTYLLSLNLFKTYTAVLFAFSCSLDIITIGTHVAAFTLKKEPINNFLECIGYLYKKNCKHVSINVIFWSVIMLVIFLTHLYNYTTAFLQSLDNWCPIVIAFIYLIMYTILMQIVYFLDFLKGQFLTLTSSIGDTESTLLNQVEEHWQLVELCHDVNELYSKQLLFGMFRLFLVLTADSFFLIYNLVRFSNHPQILKIVYPSATNFIWSLTMLLATGHTCELTKEAADSFHTALSGVLRKHKNINNEILVLYLHMKPSVNLNVCGFFSLGRHAISSVLAVVVTYLVILVQISNPTTVEEDNK
ncbi:unnamed protein product [Nezara viridula]|uniref:Gustatory receptor n=1 Tax=Nezara viridula TaxID=85310 RepID=A0A9P0MP19_NEZVI|nr:unnamed protein product [Nezara viridula]